MTKDTENNRLMYIIFGAALCVIAFLLANNLAYYRYDGFNGIEMAVNDLGNLRFHISFETIYLQYDLFAILAVVIAITAFMANEEKFRRDAAGIEAGSAKWNQNFSAYNKKFTEPFKSTKNDGSSNMIHSKRVFLSLQDYKTRLNCNVLIVGGAGTGKSRFVIKPNLLQMNCSYVVTDPSGELLGSLGNAMLKEGYTIRIFNLVNMDYSNCYNPFRYIRDEAGVGVLVDTLISNTTPPESSASDPFWEKSETALYSACIYYLLDFADEDDQNFGMMLKMILLAQLDENAKGAQKSDLDKIFEGEKRIDNGNVVDVPKGEREILASRIRESQAWKNYQTFRLGGVKTLKSVLISAAVRLNPFNVKAIANLTSRDNISLETIGDKKTILFVIIPQANSTYNFLASMLYSQLFDTLYYRAEHTHPTKEEPDLKDLRLRYHVRFLLDEFANSVTRSTPKTVGITDKSVA